MTRVKPTQQIYSNYSKEDFDVWSTLFNRQLKLLRLHASTDYLIALQKIGFSADTIPDFDDVNARLKALTGWSLVTVPCISAQKDFFDFLTQKKFTATCWLRKMAELDYLEEPDMFHDVFGHAPLLTNENYCQFFEQIGKLALQHIDNPEVIEKLGRVYWFTIEFGLIREAGEIKVFGAGIMSSNAECINALKPETKKIDFDIVTMLNTEYRTDVLQDKYFVTESFAQLAGSIPELENEIAKIAQKTNSTHFMQ